MVNNEKTLLITLATKVIESPITGNACHVISYPGQSGDVLVNDLDMGKIYDVSLTDLVSAKVFRNVEKEDFQFSWVIDSYDEELYDAVMMSLGI